MDAHKNLNGVLKTVYVGIILCSSSFFLSCSKNIETRERANLANWCSGTGKITGINGNMCPENTNKANESWDVYHEMALYTAAEGYWKFKDLLPITNCKFEAMKIYFTDKIKLRVETYLNDDDEPNDVGSSYQVTNLSSNEPCGLLLNFSGRDLRVLLAPGMIVYASNDYTMLADVDQWSTRTLRSEDGNLLYAETMSISPEKWSKLLLPEFFIQTDENAICATRNISPGTFLVKFSLFNKDKEKCTLDALTYRCCNLGGVDYKVLSNGAYRNINNPLRGDRVNLMIARSDVLGFVQKKH